MRAFRCNHNVQVLIGGSEMAERMYYACKYTTKDQYKVEWCTIAFTLAGFETRLFREKAIVQKLAIPYLMNKYVIGILPPTCFT